MLTHASSVTQELRTDVCIIGAGAAGIAIAKQFESGSRTDVLLLEGGELDPTAAAQALYEGEWTGNIHSKKYLTASRVRCFGGTTFHWTGTCRPHDPIDFETRPWVPDSGWPMERSEVLPYYQRAVDLVQVRAFADDGPDGALYPVNVLDTGESSRFASKVLHMSPPTRFATVHGPALRSSKVVRVVLGANVVNIRKLRPDSREVDRVDVATFSGERFSVRARYFVLATGTFENARILLNSNNDQPEGLGNQHDNVGRFYMDHARVPPTGLLSWTDETRQRANRKHRATLFKRLGHGFYSILSPTAQTQREREMLNGGLRLRAFSRKELSEAESDVESEVQRLATNVDGGGPGFGAARTGGLFSLTCYPEEAPNRESRVTLTDERDALGQRKISVHWEATAQTRREMVRLVDLLAHEAGRTGYGRGRILVSPEPYEPESAHMGNHPSGTTRMSSDPRNGVTDAHGRVHGTENLYVAGSSLFPTAGFANPTLTLLALALRLADHLKARVEKG